MAMEDHTRKIRTRLRRITDHRTMPLRRMRNASQCTKSGRVACTPRPLVTRVLGMTRSGGVLRLHPGYASRIVGGLRFSR